MATIDTVLVVLILLFLAILIWARVEGSSMIDKMREIRDFIQETFSNKPEVP